MFRLKILQVRLEHSEEKIDIVSWLRDFEHTLMLEAGSWELGVVRLVADLLRIGKMNREGELFRDQINAAQPQGELFEEPPKHEKQRLGRFDLMIELER